jgi:ribonucleotide monophosphatase NagD (HAD superfamily)
MNGAKLVATHKSRYFERQDGLAIGPGAFVSALEYASGKEAIVVGKPSPNFYQSVVKDFNCPPSEVVMIGDVRKHILHCSKLSFFP